MTAAIRLSATIAAIAVLATAVSSQANPAMQVGEKDIGGVVTGDRGSEAGVWVIAETNDLPTNSVRIAVTDEPFPQFKGVTEHGSSEASYYTWVDQFDVLGLGANTPINTGNQSEALLALRSGEWVAR